MAKKVSDGRELVKGVASRKDRIFIISKIKEALALGAAHTSVVSVQSGTLHACVSTEWDSTAIAVARLPAPKLVIVGEDGEVCIYLGDRKSATETIKPAPRMIRNAKSIGGYVYVCGMKRQVYKRSDEKKWDPMNAPAPTGDDAVGFEAIDGYSAAEIYAVGWQGEIWQYDGKKWHDRSTPTNLVLACVCCTPKKVYVAGQKGTMLRGRGDSWELIDFKDEFDLDIWDLCWFDDELYVATITGLYTLEGDKLVDVDFGAEGTPMCYSLSTAEGVLWSVGRDDVASFDGKKWQRY
jgi:hypothetical protein